MRLHKIAEGLAAALVLLLAVAGVPALLVAIGAAPTSVPSLDQVRRALFVQDQNMTVVFAVLAAIAWFCWAAFTLSTFREIAAAIATRGRGSARPLPRLEWVGRPAAQLVAAVVLVFVSAPGLISATTPSAVAAPVVATATRATPRAATHPDDGTHSAVTYADATYADATYTAATHAAATHPTPVREGVASTASSRRQPKRATYTVQRRDTLWSIAATQLGDPLRWPELAHLNPAVVGPAPDFLIQAGSTLALAPAGDHGLGQGAEQVVAVRAGDTVSGIAAEHGAGDWRTIWPANQDRPEPGGAALTNPNHIEPGWTLAVPAVSPPRAPSTISPLAATRAPSSAPAGTPKVQLPHGLSSGMRSRDLPPQRLTVTQPGVKADSLKHQPTRGVVPQDSAVGLHPVNRLTPNTPNTPDIQHTPQGVGSQIGAFSAGGALLAGGVLGALLVARRRQSRSRRPGRTIATTAP